MNRPAINSMRQFDPGRASRSFRLALSDLGELYFLPSLVKALQLAGPSIGLEVVQIDSGRAAEWLQTGHVDAVVGNLRFVGGQVRREVLFTESSSCLVSAGHPVTGDSLSLEEYVAASHAVVTALTGHRLVDDVMSEMGLARKVVLRRQPVLVSACRRFGLAAMVLRHGSPDVERCLMGESHSPRD